MPRFTLVSSRCCGTSSAGSYTARRRVYGALSQLVFFCPPSRHGGRSHILFLAKLLHYQHVMKNIR